MSMSREQLIAHAAYGFAFTRAADAVEYDRLLAAAIHDLGAVDPTARPDLFHEVVKAMDAYIAPLVLRGLVRVNPRVAHPL